MIRWEIEGRDGDSRLLQVIKSTVHPCSFLATQSSPNIALSWADHKIMDPLSFSASLVAISTLAVAALKTSLLLYDFAKELQAASEDIENFALDIQAFGFVIDTGHECLKDYCEKEPTSQVLNYFKDLQIVHSLGKLSKRTNEQIDCACRQTESTQSRSKTLTQIKWVFRNRKLFDALYPDMASLRSSFTLVMLYITYEIAQKRGDSEETRQEV
jgi:hypothetical protein